MPVRTLDATQSSKESGALIKRFKQRIVGQGNATDALVGLYEKFQSGMYDKTRPIGIALALGPTGTGKTLLGEVMAEGLFGHVKHMMKVDCGEFQHSHEIAKLVGSPPGYLGHRETHPFFTNASLKEARSKGDKEIHPFTIIQWDEIEKASDTLWNLLLGIFDKGVLTTGTNERVDFTPTIHLLTSNVGASEISDDNSLGFATGEKVVDDDKLEAIAMNAARKKFPPEFLNRIDYTLNFKTLTPENLREILSLELELIQNRIVEGSVKLFELRVSLAGVAQILKDGYDRRYNARHLKRTLEKNISQPLARMVSTGQIHDGDVVMCHYLPDWESWKYMAVSRFDESAEKALASSI